MNTKTGSFCVSLNLLMNLLHALEGTPPMLMIMQFDFFQKLCLFSLSNIPFVSIAKMNLAFVSNFRCSTFVGSAALGMVFHDAYHLLVPTRGGCTQRPTPSHL